MNVLQLRQVLDWSAVYRLWQAPFAARKFAPILVNDALASARRVLDVGCGPGTNARYFRQVPYVGIDLSRRYVRGAMRRLGPAVAVADARALPVASARFDFVLLNSLLHHVDDHGAGAVLREVARVLTLDGQVHVLDLVRPPRPSAARLLARWDRGRYARPLEEWRALFDAHFQPLAFEPYALGLGRWPLWCMVYFKGGRRSHA